MGEIRQIALDLQQDIATSDDPGCVARRLAGRGETEIEEILSLEIDGRTVFQAIASHDRANVLEKILSCGVNINRVDRCGHYRSSQECQNPKWGKEGNDLTTAHSCLEVKLSRGSEWK